MENTREREFAVARDVKVLETLIDHAVDLVVFLDGSSGENPADMRRVVQPLEFNFTAKPAGLRSDFRQGRLGLWFDATTALIDGIADQNAMTRAPVANFIVTAEVRDRSGTFNPRAFSLSLGSGNGQSINLYPSLPALQRRPAGSLSGRLHHSVTSQPVAWAIVELRVSVAANTQIYRGQANGRGEFALMLTRLPPLPTGTTEYAAQLQVFAQENVQPGDILDPGNFVAFEMESAASANSFDTEFSLAIRTGETARVNSFNQNFIATRAV